VPLSDHLRLLRTRFSPLETQLLAAVRDVLPARAHATFDAQVAAVNKAQRSPPSWAEIAFYRTRWGRADWSSVPLFGRVGEFRCAEVRFRADGRPFKSTLTCIRGHIFDFATSPGPRDVAFLQWDVAAIARLLADPGQETGAAREVEVLPAVWTGELRSEAVKVMQGWQVYDETSAYRVALADGVYLVLAERDGDDFLMYRLDPPSTELFSLIHHDGDPVQITGPAGFLERWGRAKV